MNRDLTEHFDNKKNGLNTSYALICVTAILTGFGLVAIYAASSLKGAEQFGDPFFFFRRQAWAAVIGFSLIGLTQILPFRWIERATLPILVVTTGLLLLIFVPGAYSTVKGASRWLNIPYLGGQPAELAKLALCLFLAKNLSRPSTNIDHFSRGILPNLLVLITFSTLVLLQRDLGTTFLLFALTVVMLFAAGISRRYLYGAGLVGIVGVAALVVVEPYRIRRIFGFLDPWAEASGSGFQIIQSFLAFNNGGFMGVGLGESKQKLFFLPEAHTDFILSVIGEEMGLVGVVFVCAMFFYLCYLGFRVTARQTQSHKAFLAFGLTMLLVMQALLNMGVTMGILPTKGMPLPFISSGRSSLLVSLMMIAILARLARETYVGGRVSAFSGDRAKSENSQPKKSPRGLRWIR